MHHHPVKCEGDLEIPLILDETFGIAQDATLRYGADGDEGLLAGAVFSLSMSEQAKDCPSQLQDLHSPPAFQNETYLYAPPALAPQPHCPASDILSLQDDEGRSVLAEASYQGAMAVEVPQASQKLHQPQHQQHQQQQQGPSQVLEHPRRRQQPLSPSLEPYINPQAHPPPIVQSYHPDQGSEGTEILVTIYSTYDLLAPPPLHFTFMFGTQLCHSTAVSKLEPQDPYYRYLLSVDAPAFETTDWGNPDVAVCLRMSDDSGQNLGVVEVGDFTYPETELRRAPSHPSPATTSRKRKPSRELEGSSLPVKRQSTGPNPHRASSEGHLVRAPTTRSRGLSYSTYLQPGLPVDLSPAARHYDRSFSGQGAYLDDSAERSATYPLSHASLFASRPHSRSSPSAAGWSESYGTVSSLESHSPQLSTTSASNMSQVPSISPADDASNPPLIRTSTIQHPAGAGPGSAATMQMGQGFNPYTMYPHKAVLDIQGDLDAMTSDWTDAEAQSRRRLVQFRRQQSGNTIHTSFAPVAPDDRPPHSICISCIWWEEKQECFVTSVDTIYLLESLVAVRFTVEEKNRIRRNLEGFRPLTVSKAKADSEEFFKVIMGFPNPKPRNIEKDVKVFPWKILTQALRKIISKYSASYSSTAGALRPPASGGGGGPSYDPAGPVAFHYVDSSPEPDRSPRTSMVGGISMAYPPGVQATVGPMGGGAGISGSSDLRLAVPPLPQGSLSSPQRWMVSPQQQLSSQQLLPQQQQQQQQQQYLPPPSDSQGFTMGGPAPRGSWDLSSYIGTDPSGDMAGPAGQPIYYQHAQPPPQSQQQQQQQQQQQRQEGGGSLDPYPPPPHGQHPTS